MRVLIAEDSDIERMVLQEAVEGLGHECVTAADASGVSPVLATQRDSFADSSAIRTGLAR